jgi:hypothetical protein
MRPIASVLLLLVGGLSHATAAADVSTWTLNGVRLKMGAWEGYQAAARALEAEFGRLPFVIFDDVLRKKCFPPVEPPLDVPPRFPTECFFAVTLHTETLGGKAVTLRFVQDASTFSAVVAQVLVDFSRDSRGVDAAELLGQARERYGPHDKVAADGCYVWGNEDGGQVTRRGGPAYRFCILRQDEAKGDDVTLELVDLDYMRSAEEAYRQRVGPRPPRIKLP